MSAVMSDTRDTIITARGDTAEGSEHCCISMRDAVKPTKYTDRCADGCMFVVRTRQT